MPPRSKCPIFAIDVSFAVVKDEAERYYLNQRRLYWRGGG
jgi:hypothetical protein